MGLSEHLSSSTAYAEAIVMLLQRGGTTREISDHSGLAYNTTRKMIYALRRRGVLRVVLWREDGIGRRRTPAWVIGSGPDAVQPRRTEAERRERYDAKRQAIADQLGIAMSNVRLRDHKEMRDDTTT